MIAGRMRTRLSILEPTVTVNDFGEEAVTYRSWATIKAERIRHTAARSEEVGEHFPEHRAEFNIRIAHAVGENWRAREVGGVLYTVVAVIPNVPRGYKTLICDKVNE